MQRNQTRKGVEYFARRYIRLGEEKKNKIVRLRTEGLTLDKIAKKMEIPRTTVHDALHGMGLTNEQEPGKKITPKILARAEELGDEGVNLVDVADLLLVNESALSKRLVHEGVRVHKEHARGPLSEAKKVKIIKLRQGGMKLITIAKKLKIPRPTVSGFLSREGLVKRRKKDLDVEEQNES